MSWYSFAPYVSVAQRRAKAKRELAALEKKTGHKPDPVVIDGRKIAATFWGKAWCDNLESYGDFASRLPRGRSYVRNGSVCDLAVEPGKVSARVCGSELYRVTVTVKPLAAGAWAAVKRACAGQIGSLVELLKGRLSEQVMKVVTGRPDGLFPAPREIDMSCSCPDYATMCKHVAATLYGIGARLDRQPELLFTLRGVDHLDLIAEAGRAPAAAGGAGGGGSGKKRLAAGDLSDVFGIELEPAAAGGRQVASVDAGATKGVGAVKKARAKAAVATAAAGRTTSAKAIKSAAGRARPGKKQPATSTRKGGKPDRSPVVRTPVKRVRRAKGT
jgi:hypothetical protein